MRSGYRKRCDYKEIYKRYLELSEELKDSIEPREMRTVISARLGISWMTLTNVIKRGEKGEI